MYDKRTRKKAQARLSALQSARYRSPGIAPPKSKNWHKNLEEIRNRPPPAPPPQTLAPDFTFGVQFRAPWALWGNGICEAWRRLALALAHTGTPVHLVLDELYGRAAPEAIAQVKPLLTPKRANLFVGGFPTAGDALQSAVINKILNDKSVPVVLTTLLERDRIGPASAAQAMRAAEWWLPCKATRDVFARAGVPTEKLKVVHIPFFPNDPHLDLVRAERTPGVPHFYRIGIIDTRKDQAKMLRAFLRAFRPGEARLTLKTYAIVQDLGVWKTDPEVLSNGWNDETFGKWVRVVNEMWPPARLIELHREGDIYLSLSHGEGWDMPAFDALLAGNRMVYTESGGPQEFAAEGDLLVPTSAWVPCDPVYGWEPDALWVDYEIDAAARQMQRAAEMPLRKQVRRDWETFSSGYVGKQMVRLLSGLVPAGASAHRDAARSVLVRWTGVTEPARVDSLAGTYTKEELFAASGTGPVTPDEAIAAERTEVLFLYQPKTVPCGVASHTRELVKAHPRASWVASVADVKAIARRKKVVALVIEVPLGGIPARDVSHLIELRNSGIRIVLDEHHADRDLNWQRQFRMRVGLAKEIIFYNPDAPAKAGAGTYVPLPVPKLEVSPRSHVGGLCFVGFADPSRRIDALVAVAERLHVPIYGYGPHLGQIPNWYPARTWQMYRPMRSYLDENEGASEVARHDVALFARTPGCLAYASASARFCIAAGIPVVVDASETYRDLASAVTVVNYDEPNSCDRAVRNLLSTQGRIAALIRQAQYLRSHTPETVLRAMNLL